MCHATKTSKNKYVISIVYLDCSLQCQPQLVEGDQIPNKNLTRFQPAKAIHRLAKGSLDQNHKVIVESTKTLTGVMRHRGKTPRRLGMSQSRCNRSRCYFEVVACIWPDDQLSRFDIR